MEKWETKAWDMVSIQTWHIMLLLTLWLQSLPLEEVSYQLFLPFPVSGQESLFLPSAFDIVQSHPLFH